MGMFDSIAAQQHRNSEAQRAACQNVVLEALRAGTLRLSDTFAAPNPWATMAREVLTGRVGREERQFGAKDRLSVRLAIEKPLTRTIGQKPYTFGDVERVEPVVEEFAVGIHDVPAETALWLLWKSGAGVVEHVTPGQRGTIIEIGYSFPDEAGRQRFHETLPEGHAPKAQPGEPTLRQRVESVADGQALAPEPAIDETEALRARIAELEAQVAAKALEPEAPARKGKSAPLPVSP